MEMCKCVSLRDASVSVCATIYYAYYEYQSNLTVFVREREGDQTCKALIHLVAKMSLTTSSRVLQKKG